MNLPPEFQIMQDLKNLICHLHDISQTEISDETESLVEQVNVDMLSIDEKMQTLYVANEAISLLVQIPFMSCGEKFSPSLVQSEAHSTFCFLNVVLKEYFQAWTSDGETVY